MTSRTAEPHAPGLQPRDGARLVTDVEGPPTGPRELGERSKSCRQRLTRRWACGAGWSLLIALTGSAHAQENAVQLSGKAIARTGVIAHGTPACASCHGMSGEGVAVQDGPRLAGLDEAYLLRQLDAFSKQARPSRAMTPVARSLTAAERRAVARYYAQLPPPPRPAATAPLVKAGRALALDGAWSVGIPPCASCHGADGQGVDSTTPALSGQAEAYLVAQLRRYQSGERRNDPLGLMRGIAGRMNRTQIRAVAAYYAAQPAGAESSAGPGR